jgi:hypothetical protein
VAFEEVWRRRGACRRIIAIFISRLPPRFDIDLVSGTGVNGVSTSSFCNRHRALDYLAGRDLVAKLSGKNKPDFIHLP